MKKEFYRLFMAVIIITAVGLTACGSAKKPQTVTVDPNRGSGTFEVEPGTITTDWKGRNIGGSIPQWVTDHVMNPLSAARTISEETGKEIVFIFSETGANLSGVQRALNQSAVAAAAQSIRVAASREGGNVLQGDYQNDPVVASFVSQFDTIYASATITGLGPIADFWVKDRNVSDDKETYTCYVAVGISKADMNASIAQTFGRIDAATVEQQKLKEDVQERITRLMESTDF